MARVRRLAESRFITERRDVSGGARFIGAPFPRKKPAADDALGLGEPSSQRAREMSNVLTTFNYGLVILRRVQISIISSLTVSLPCCA